MAIVRDKITVHIVPSTHWDREWYLPQRRFQFKLVKLMDKVLDLFERGIYQHFLLDGQTIMLEDYTEVRSKAFPILRQYVGSKQLAVGPWYVVPDLFLPSGESIVRNLLIGKEISLAYGNRQNIGYTPDSFGLISQMPQIFSQFGLDGAFFSRGIRGQQEGQIAECVWKSPDGTELPAIYENYNNAVFLSYPDIWKNIDLVDLNIDEIEKKAVELLEIQDRVYSTRHRLWIVGIDHIEPGDRLIEVVASLSGRISGVEFVHSSLERYFKERSIEGEKLPLIHGEQRGPLKEHFVLGNTLSSRMDIKLLNRHCENLLQYYADPLSVYSRSINKDSFNSEGIINLAWKLLVQNHAHDSICTCGSDETNQDIETRLRQVEQMANDMLHCHLVEIGKAVRPWKEDTDQGATVMVYNPTGCFRSDVVQGVVRVPKELPEAGLCVLDDMGNVIEGADVKVIAKKRIDLETMKMSDQQLLKDTTRYHLGPYKSHDMYTMLDVCWKADEVPPQGYRCYRIMPLSHTKQTGTCDGVIIHSDGIENSFYRIFTGETGSVDVLDKKSGKLYKDIIFIEDTADAGDTYTYSPIEDDTAIVTKSFKPVLKYDHVGKNVASFTLEWNMLLPDKVIQKRRSAVLKSVWIICKISLYKDSRVINTSVHVNNTVSDHRVRIMFNLPYHADKTWSDTPFDFVERKVFKEGELPWPQIQTMPFRNVIKVENNQEREGVLLLSRGSCEYEAFTNDEGTSLGITVLRSVGAVYSTVLATRDESSCGIGTRWWTERGKCLGDIQVELGLCFFSGDISSGEAINLGMEYNLPMKPMAIEPKGTLPNRLSFVEINPDNLVFSTTACYGDDTRGNFVRFYNPDNKPKNVQVKWHKYINQAFEVTLEGERVTPLNILNGYSVECPTEPGQIKTIEILS